MFLANLIFVISFTQAGFSKTKFYTQKTTKDTKNTKNVYEKVKCMQFFSLNLEKITPDRNFLHWHRRWCWWQIWGMGENSDKDDDDDDDDVVFNQSIK